MATTTWCQADIFRWDNGALIPGTEGIIPGPGVQLNDRDLEYANLSQLPGVNLTGSQFSSSNLSSALFESAILRDANFAGANLVGTNLDIAVLTHADLTGAVVTGASFRSTTLRGFTKEQLYSTASYRGKDLRGIHFGPFVLGWSVGPLNDLTGWNFSEQNLTNANFVWATLTDANFTDAVVAGASFGDTTSRGFTKEQLYATASYKAKNLPGIRLVGNNLSGWDFREQNLSGADFVGKLTNLTNSSLESANLMNTMFSLVGDPNKGAVLTDANLAYADLRGARVFDLTGAIMNDTILPNGTIAGLELFAAERLLVRDDDGLSASLPTGIPARLPIPVAIQDRALFAEGGVLQLSFDADPWDSLISFEAGIPVELAGSLELSFADGVDVEMQIGRTLRIFDWTGVSPVGQFEIQGPYDWDTTNLYTTGEVTLTAITGLPGDFNLDGSVGAADYVAWRKGLGTVYTQDDYNVWRAHFGETHPTLGATGSASASPNYLAGIVPEPSCEILLLVGAIWLARSTKMVQARKQ
jgi:uncharacterized protein YjbI with pentapeptide repeats